MKNKFKLGDEVRIIANESDSLNAIGDIGHIVKISNQDQSFRVKVEGGADYSIWHEESDLELINKNK